MSFFGDLLTIPYKYFDMATSRPGDYLFGPNNGNGNSSNLPKTGPTRFINDIRTVVFVSGPDVPVMLEMYDAPVKKEVVLPSGFILPAPKDYSWAWYVEIDDGYVYLVHMCLADCNDLLAKRPKRKP